MSQWTKSEKITFPDNFSTNAQCSISIERGVIKSNGHPDNSKMLKKALKYHSDDIFLFDLMKKLINPV